MPKSRLSRADAVGTQAPDIERPMDIERINAIGNTLADLSERTNALRGYL